jgi:hypothetical protein
MPDEELFETEEVLVDVPVYDLPGRPRKKVQCHSCGEWIRDDREKRENGTILCQICAGGAYFRRFQKDDPLTAAAGNSQEPRREILLSKSAETAAWRDSKPRIKVAKP